MGQKKVVDLLKVQETFGRITRRELLPTRGTCPKNCSQLARRARGECTPQNCIELHKKPKALIALKVASGKKKSRPKGIPYKDRRTLAELDPGYNYSNFERKRLKKEYKKMGIEDPVPKFTRKSRVKKAKTRFNKEVVVLETNQGRCASKEILKEVWQGFLEKANLLNFRIMKSDVAEFPHSPFSEVHQGIPPLKERVVLVTKEGISKDDRQLKRSWKKILKNIAPHYKVVLAKVYKGKGKVKNQ